MTVFSHIATEVAPQHDGLIARNDLPFSRHNGTIPVHERKLSRRDLTISENDKFGTPRDCWLILTT